MEHDRDTPKLETFWSAEDAAKAVSAGIIAGYETDNDGHLISVTYIALGRRQILRKPTIRCEPMPIDCGRYGESTDDNATTATGGADVARDGTWAIAALQRVVKNGGGSESVGCRIDRLINNDVKMNGDFALLLAAAVAALTASKT